MKNLLAAAALTVCATSASAVTYDFIDAIDGATGPINESIWTEFTTGDYAYFAGPSISLKGVRDTDGLNNGNDPVAAFAYADAGTAGFGVCGTAKNFWDGTKVDIAQPFTSNGTNVCADASDDSIQASAFEYLIITAEEALKLISITLNANHDGKLTMDSVVYVDGVAYTGNSANASFANGYLTITLNALWGVGDSLAISSGGKHLYLSAVELAPVPLPAAGLLLLGGLGGLAGLRRRQRA